MHVDEDGYIAKKQIGRWIIVVMPLTFGRARIGLGRDWDTFDNVW